MPVDRSLLTQLENRRAALAADLRTRLEAAEREGRRELRADERQMCHDLQRLSAAIDDHGEPLERRAAIDRNETVQRLRARAGGGLQRRGGVTAGRLAPLGFTDEQLRSAHAKIGRGETVVLETRDFVTGVPELPPQLFPVPTFPRHEARLLGRLPGYALEAPSMEYVQVNSVSGAAAIVGEGQLKPELDMPATKLIITALKLACHVGISWENINDYDAFTASVHTELLKQIIDLENHQLVFGNPASGGLNGMLTTPGILTFAAQGTTTTNPNNLDDIAGAIAALRTGPALASPDLLLHPDTWAAIRTQKDLYGRYLAQPDPTDEQVETVWGLDVLQSTAFGAGTGILLDTTLFGKVAVREPLTLRIGYANDDLVRNILRLRRRGTPQLGR